MILINRTFYLELVLSGVEKISVIAMFLQLVRFECS